MKLIRYVIALAALAASTQTLAATPQADNVTTTGELIELCGVSVDDPLYNAAMGFCLGYIDAALDYHAALTAGAEQRCHYLSAHHGQPGRRWWSWLWNGPNVMRSI